MAVAFSRRQALVLRPGHRAGRWPLPSSGARTTSSSPTSTSRSMRPTRRSRDLDTKIEQGRAARAQAAAVPRGSEPAGARAGEAAPHPAVDAQHRRDHQEDQDARRPGRLHAAQADLPAARSARRGAIRTPSGRSRSRSTAAITTWPSSSIVSATSRASSTSSRSPSPRCRCRPSGPSPPTSSPRRSSTSSRRSRKPAATAQEAGAENDEIRADSRCRF